MEKVIYGGKSGLGIILANNEIESDYIVEKSFTINGQELRTGMFTNLFGMFNEAVKYVGVLKSDLKCMCFLLGTEENIFSNLTYYSCFYWISENRLANKYAEGTVRDYNFINGKWK